MSAYQIREIPYPLAGTGRVISTIAAEGIKKALRAAETATGAAIHTYSMDRDGAEGYGSEGRIIRVSKDS